MKNWFTYSTAEIPKSFFAFAGKSRLVILPSNKVLCNDHSASDILKNNAGAAAATLDVESACVVPSEGFPEQAFRKNEPAPALTVMSPNDLKNSLRFGCGFMVIVLRMEVNKFSAWFFKFYANGSPCVFRIMRLAMGLTLMARLIAMLDAQAEPNNFWICRPAQ